MKLSLTRASNFACSRRCQQCEPQRESDLPGNWGQHDAAPEHSDFVIRQHPATDFFDAALSQSRSRISFEQAGVDGKTEDLADETVHAVARCMLAGADDGFDEFDDVNAADSAEIAL